MYNIMIEGRTGTRRLVHDGWEDEYHTITWTTEETYELAQETVDRLLAKPNRDIRSVWVEPRGEN